MAMASTALHPCVRFPAHLCSSVQKGPFFATPLLRFPFSIAHLKLFLSRPVSSSSSSSALTDSTPPILFDYQARVVESEFLDKYDSTTEEDKLLVDQKEEEVEPFPEKRAAKPASTSLPCFSTPRLTIKEKKELASYAHSLGKKLKCQQVGKSGVTPSVAAAMVEALEANELLKNEVKFMSNTYVFIMWIYSQMIRLKYMEAALGS